jgi:hypothetical protein
MKILLVLALCVASAALEAQQFREWSFQAPAGWQLSQHDDSATLAPPDAMPGTVYLRLFPAQNFPGTLQSWLEQRVQQETQGLTVLQTTPAGSLSTSGLQEMVVLQLPDGQKAVRMYIGKSPSPGVGELMVFHAPAAVAKTYTPVLNPFVSSVRFSATGAAAAPPQPEPAPQPVSSAAASSGNFPEGIVNGGTGLQGWYAKSTTRVMPGMGFTTSVKTVFQFYRFFPDGWVYTSLPPQGPVDTIQCPQAGTGEGGCVRYRLSGRSISIGSDGPKSFELVPGPDGEIRVSGVGMWPLRPLPGTPSGTYQAVSGSGMMGTGSLRIEDMTFLPGGRFTSSRSTSVASNTANTSAGAYRGGSATGQYRLAGPYQIEFQFQDGTRSSARIVAPTQDIEMLLIGDTTFIRKNSR